ncbi:MAG: dephospho-CoA kinase [Alphaproteobacteria bacterium]|nr:MAG: dephospho-CoA kinase [Alphaproteobacteria bacterium]
MLILGLTGSIGMGKSTVADHLRERGVPVLDADAVVHDLYRGAAAARIGEAFPGVVREGTVDREALSRALVGHPERLAELEAIVHPLVREAERDFLLRAERAGAPIAVLEIPLLFETGGDALVDATLVVSAPPAVQRERVLARPGMSEAKFTRLVANQMPDEEKRARADFVVDTSRAKEETFAQVDAIMESLRGRQGSAIERWRARE